MTFDEQRAYINKALSSGKYDEKFTELSRALMRSNNNLPKIIKDIDSYSNSNYGQYHQYAMETESAVLSYKKPLAITLTSKFNIDDNKIKNEYEYLIKHISATLTGKRYVRYKRTIPNIAYVEGGTVDTRIHMHAVIDVPPYVDMEEMIETIQKRWKQTGSVQFDDAIIAQLRKNARKSISDIAAEVNLSRSAVS